MFEQAIEFFLGRAADAVGGMDEPPRAPAGSFLQPLLARGLIVVAMAAVGYWGYGQIERTKNCERDIAKLGAERNTPPALLLSMVRALRAEKCEPWRLQTALDAVDSSLVKVVSDASNPIPIDWLRSLDTAAIAATFPAFGKMLLDDEWRVRAAISDSDAKMCAVASELNSFEDETGEPRFEFAVFERDQKYLSLSKARSLSCALQLSDDVLRTWGATSPLVHDVKGKFTCKPPGVHKELRGPAHERQDPDPRWHRADGPTHVRPYPNATYLALRATPDATTDNIIGRVRRGGTIKVMGTVSSASGGTWLDIACEGESVQCLFSHATHHLVAANQTNWFERPGGK